LSDVEHEQEKYAGISLPMWGIAVSMMAVTLWMVFFQAVREKSLHVVQRLGVLYWSSVVVVVAAFLLVTVCSAIYLVVRQPRWDHRAYAAAEIGTLFCTMVLVAGPLWVQSGWNVWWLWDERFTTTSALWCLACVYLLIRKYAPGPVGRPLSAVLGSMLFWMLLVIYLGVRAWQTIHPAAFRLEGWGTASVAFGTPLVISVCSFLIVFAYLFQQRVAIETMKDDLEGVRQAFLGQEQQMRDFRVENQDFIIEGYTFKEYKKYE
jgi:heme exporter protein C